MSQFIHVAILFTFCFTIINENIESSMKSKINFHNLTSLYHVSMVGEVILHNCFDIVCCISGPFTALVIVWTLVHY